MTNSIHDLMRDKIKSLQFDDSPQAETTFGVKKLAERIAELTYEIREDLKIKHVPPHKIRKEVIASIAAELAPVLERITALEEALRECRDYVAMARGGTELSLTLEESEVRKAEIQKELEVHTGLLSRIDALLKENRDGTC